MSSHNDARPAPAVAGNEPREIDRLGGTISPNHNARNARRQYLVAHLHRAGPRPVLEAMLELERGHELDLVLEQFGRVPVEAYHAVGADAFPGLRAVEGDA